LPTTKVVFLTLDPGIRDLALATGAAGHVSKDQPPQEIMRVVRAAAGIIAPTAPSRALSAQAKLAELLVTEKDLSARQVQDLDRARETKQTLSNALLRSGLVSEESLAAMLARVSGRAVVSLAPSIRSRRHARRSVPPVRDGSRSSSVPEHRRRGAREPHRVPGLRRGAPRNRRFRGRDWQRARAAG